MKTIKNLVVKQQMALWFLKNVFLNFKTYGLVNHFSGFINLCLCNTINFLMVIQLCFCFIYKKHKFSFLPKFGATVTLRIFKNYFSSKLLTRFFFFHLKTKQTKTIHFKRYYNTRAVPQHRVLRFGEKSARSWLIFRKHQLEIQIV